MAYSKVAPVSVSHSTEKTHLNNTLTQVFTFSGNFPRLKTWQDYNAYLSIDTQNQIEIGQKGSQKSPNSSQRPRSRAPKGYRTLLKCPYCEKSWNNQYKLQRHLLTHTGDRPYECDICQRKFTQKSHMEGHKVLHFEQDFPDKSFTNQKAT